MSETTELLIVEARARAKWLDEHAKDHKTAGLVYRLAMALEDTEKLLRIEEGWVKRYRDEYVKRAGRDDGLVARSERADVDARQV